MDHHDRLGSFRQDVSDSDGVNVEGFRQDVDENRLGPAINDGIRRRDPGERRHHNLVVRSNPKCGERQMKGRRSAAGGGCEPAAECRGKGLFEGSRYRPLGKPPGKQGFTKRLPLLVAGVRFCDWQVFWVGH